MAKIETVWFCFEDNRTVEIPADTPCRVQIGSLQVADKYELGFIGKTECGFCEVFYNNAWYGGNKVPQPIILRLVVEVRIQSGREINNIMNGVHHALTRNVESIPGVIDFLKVGIAPEKPSELNASARNEPT